MNEARERYALAVTIGIPLPHSGTAEALPSLLAAAILVCACHQPRPAVPQPRPAEPQAGRRVALEECRLPGFDEVLAELPPAQAAELRDADRGLCGTWEVFEDRARGAGRKLELRVIVLPATGEQPAADPLLIFYGGPGSSIFEDVAFVPVDFAAIHARRDLVLIDQRGTGGSHLLRCPPRGSDDDLQGYLEAIPPRASVVACRRQLERRADLRLYTTPHAVDDFDDVRAALGYQRVNLWGISYGTRVAQVYLRRHPRSVRAAVLLGVVSTDARYPLYHAPYGQRALERILEACAADAACAGAFPDPRADLAAALQRFADGPVEVEVDSPGPRRDRVTVALSRDVFAETLRSKLYGAASAVTVPSLLAKAAAGDFTELARAALEWGRYRQDSFGTGMALSVTCSEDAPSITVEDVARETAGTFLGDYRVRRQRAACAAWPRGELPAGYGEPVRSETPVLIFAGDLDPVTPPETAEEVARSLPRARIIRMSNQGHGPSGEDGRRCMSEAIRDFLETASAEEVDASCLERVDLPPFVLPAAAGANPEELD